MHAVRSDVIHFHDRALRDLALDAEIPLLHIRKGTGLGESVVIGESQRIRRRAELSDVRRRVLHVVGGHLGQTLRQLERLRDAGAQIVKGLLHGVAGEKNLAAEVGKDSRIEDPESRANHRLGRQAVGEPGARSEVELGGCQVQGIGSVFAREEHLARGWIDARVLVIGGA